MNTPPTVSASPTSNRTAVSTMFDTSWSPRQMSNSRRISVLAARGAGGLERRVAVVFLGHPFDLVRVPLSRLLVVDGAEVSLVDLHRDRRRPVGTGETRQRALLPEVAPPVRRRVREDDHVLLVVTVRSF